MLLNLSLTKGTLYFLTTVMLIMSVKFGNRSANRIIVPTSESLVPVSYTAKICLETL